MSRRRWKSSLSFLSLVCLLLGVPWTSAQNIHFPARRNSSNLTEISLSHLLSRQNAELSASAEDELSNNEEEQLEPGDDFEDDEEADENQEEDDDDDDDDLEEDESEFGEEVRSDLEENQQGWLPKIYGMLKNTFTFGKEETKKVPYLDDDEMGDDGQDGIDFDSLEGLSDEELNDEDGNDSAKGSATSTFLTDSHGVGSQGLFNIIRASFANGTQTTSNASQGRQFFPMPMYMLQGTYLVEPRLNMYIDVVLKNLGSEIKVSGIDPLHYRVLPKGRVASRVAPRRGVQPLKRRKPNKRRRQRPLRAGRFWRNRRRGNRQRKRKAAAAKKRIRSRKQIAGKNVGLGRIDGLSKVIRDGSAEMQSQTSDGNYTLVRSHFNMGPLDLTMQFRTVRGIRRAATTIHRVKVHTVTRVSNEGSEMMDFMLDRPHPETIQVRGKLFPRAQAIAKNIFSRLFSIDSFLVARVRMKTGMALMSKPTTNAG